MMEEITEIAVLDYVLFQVSSLDNSYQALICSNGIMEKLACGPLDQLAVHLPEARASHLNRSQGSFKLQLDESTQSSSWFNKFTIARFLQIVNAPNILKLANTIENEISQLEETRSFHIALYAKPDHLHNSGVGATDISCLNDVGLTQQVKVETASSDATKNELLRALDLRLTALKEELAASFNRVVGATCCSNQISDLASFAQHFGAIELRNSLLKVLELCPNSLCFDSSTKHQISLNASGNINNEKSFSPLYAKSDVVKPATSSVSPAKVAQAERQSSSENEGSSDSSDGDSSSAERSRPVVRSATPRRSASPMRRIQIGRSGSRRSTALTIKSLNYHPARERAISNRDAGANESEDDKLEHLTKKSETNVVRMSVQDAISLFENKQKDQKADIHNRKTSEASIVANKSVLRRWSAGMGDSFNCTTREKASEFVHQIATSNLDSEALEKKEDEVKTELSNPENASAVVSDDVRTTPLYVTIPSETVVSSEGVESKDRSVTAEWNRQKEAELNEMLMKMMESSKPTKYRSAKGDFDGLKDKSVDTRGGFYSHYKEKRDEKLRAENARSDVAKEAQLKVMHETLEQSKSAMTSKTGGAVVKRESAILSQKPRRNSSPPVNSKKEASKPTSTKKVFSKSSSSPQTRSSLPSGPLKKMDGMLSAKSSPAVSTRIMPIRRRSLPSSFPAQPSPRTEKPLEHTKVNKKASNVQADVKPNLKGQEVEKLKAVKKNGKTLKPTIPLSSEDFGALSSKSSFQNKYTKKSSVVPLESKPFLKKGSGISSGTGHSIAKAKEARISKSLDSVNSSGNLVQTEENESNLAPAGGSIIKVIEDYLVQPTNVVDETLTAPLDNDMNTETANSVDGSLTRVNTDMGISVDPLIEEIQHDEDLGISSAAWVEAEHQEYSPSCNNGQQAVVSPIVAPVVSSSPRVRHSLSQMLQSDSSEPEIIIEWGNAENPPSLVYQKDSSKGLKRLLKFTRKSKGEGNLTGCSSPSAISEGEEEHEESRAANKRSSDARLRKASIQSKGYGQPKSIVSESFVGVNSSKSAMDCRGDHNVLSGSDKLQDGHILTGATATKATRSFFSLSSFRSGKSSETKPR